MENTKNNEDYEKDIINIEITLDEIYGKMATHKAEEVLIKIKKYLYKIS